MKKILTRILGVMLIALFSGCASRNGLHKEVSPEWTVTPPSVTFYVLDLKIQNGNDFNKAMPDYVGKFNDWFMPQLMQNVIAYTGIEANVFPEVSRSGKFKRTKKSMKGYMDFMASYPDVAKFPEQKGIVVTISGLTMNRHVSVKRHNGNKVYLYGVQAYAGYTVYSMDFKKELAFGKLDILEESEAYVPTEEVWSKVVRRLAHDIVAETPLIRKL